MLPKARLKVPMINSVTASRILTGDKLDTLTADKCSALYVFKLECQIPKGATIWSPLAAYRSFLNRLFALELGDPERDQIKLLCCSLDLNVDIIRLLLPLLTLRLPRDGKHLEAFLPVPLIVMSEEQWARILAILPVLCRG